MALCRAFGSLVRRLSVVIPHVVFALAPRARAGFNFTFFDRAKPRLSTACLCRRRTLLYLTMRARARSNTALFGSRPHGHQAYVSTFEDAPRAHPWLSRAQPHAGR